MPLTVDYTEGKRLRADGCVPSRGYFVRARASIKTSHLFSLL
jgi:hypothetical protein